MRRADPSGDMPFVKNPDTDKLWSFALATYQKPEVAQLCLQWQHVFGADVNLLLTAAWLASRQQTWAVDIVEGLERHCASWRAYGVVPLRAARIGVRNSVLYPAVKSLELQAERLQLAMIERWLLQSPLLVGSLPAAQCLVVNIDAYIRSPLLIALPAAATVQTLVSALDR